MSGLVGEKFPGQMGSLEFFTALPDKIFCLGLSSHSWPSGKFVYARYARYTNSNALLWLRLSSIDVFCPYFVRAKNRPSGLERLSSPRQMLFHGKHQITKCLVDMYADLEKHPLAFISSKSWNSLDWATKTFHYDS